MRDKVKLARLATLVVLLVVSIFLSLVSARLMEMCAFWEYYNYPKLKYGSQITFAELTRYAFWLERAPSYSVSACINELRQIDGATQQWALEHGKAGDDVPTWDDLKPYLGHADENHPLPCCPGGGRYFLGKVSGVPKCSVRDHRLLE